MSVMSSRFQFAPASYNMQSGFGLGAATMNFNIYLVLARVKATLHIDDRKGGLHLQ
jgi:hypothetical protein